MVDCIPNSYGSVEERIEDGEDEPLIIPERKVTLSSTDVDHYESPRISTTTTKRLFWFLSVIAMMLMLSRTLDDERGHHRHNPQLWMEHEEASLLVRVEEKESRNTTNTSMHPSPASAPAKVSYLPEFPWKRIEDDYDGSVIYIGYLELCSIVDENVTTNRHPIFFYRAATSANSTLPCQTANTTDNVTTTTTAAPVIRMNPRRNYKLILINRSHQPTNLHAHGLHVSGVGIHDDVTRNVDPGNCLEYHYRIKDNSDVGTFWYHPHRHPLVANQAAGGAYGMLIVEPPSYSGFPLHLQKFFQDNEVLLQYASILDKKRHIRTNLLNGKPEPLNLTMKSNEYYYLRVSTVVISDPINYIQFVPSNACGDVRPMAYDGVFRSSLPHPNSTDRHMMTTASRLDLAVQCQQDATIVFHQGKLSNGANLVNIHVTSSSSSDNDDDAESVVASPFWNATTKSSWHPRRPYYLPDLANVNTNFWNVASWNVTMDDSTKQMINGTLQKEEVAINHIRWDPDIAIRQFSLGQLVEWTLINTEPHPFHVHINKMQIVEKGGCGYRYEEGEYFDTIASPAPCRVRLQFWDYAGRVMVHCHKLKHEDRGMMVWIDVVGGVEHGVNGTSQIQCSAV